MTFYINFMTFVSDHCIRELEPLGMEAPRHPASIHWSSEGRSFVMRSLNPCPENFSQNVVDYPNLLRGGGVIYYAKSEVLELESNLLFLGGGGVIYYTQLEGNLLCEIRSS